MPSQKHTQSGPQTPQLSEALDSPALAIVTIDRGLHVRRFNSAAAELLELDEPHIGRPLSALADHLGAAGLVDQVRLALNTGEQQQRDILLNEQCYLRRVTPQPQTDAPPDAPAAVLEFIRLRETMHRMEMQARKQAMIAEVGHLALTAKHLDETLQYACKRVQDVYCCAMVKLMKLDAAGEWFDVHTVVGPPGHDLRGTRISADHSTHAGYTLRYGSPVLLKDLKHESRFKGSPLLHSHGMRSGLSVLVGPAARPWGVMTVHDCEINRFEESDIDLIQSVANTVFDATRMWNLIEQGKLREQQVHQVADALPVLIAYCDKDMVYRYVNKTYEQWFGLEREKIIGKPVAEVIGAEAIETVRTMIDRVFKGECVSEVRQIAYARGPRRIAQVTYAPHFTDERDAAGERVVAGYFALIEDITERTRATERLRASESRFEQAMANAPLPVFVFTEDRKVLLASHAITHLTGHATEDIRTIDDWIKLAVKGHRDASIPCQDAMPIPNGRVDQGEWEIHTADGQTRLWHFHSVGIGKTEDGRAIAVSMANDVTEHRQTEQALITLTSQLESRVQEQTKQLRLLKAVVSAANESQTQEDALREALRLICEYDDWDMGHVYMVHKERPLLLPTDICYDRSDNRFDALRQALANDALRLDDVPQLGEALSNGQFVVAHHDDPQRNPLREPLSSLGVASAFAFPVKARDVTIAMIECYKAQPHRPSEHLLAVVPEIGIQLGHVFARKELEALMIEAAEDERRKLAADLHDGVGGELVGLGMLAKAMEIRLEKQGSPLATQIKELAGHITHAHQHLRMVSQGMVPLELDGGGLVEALRELVDRYKASSGVNCTLTVSQPFSPPLKYTASHLYRIAQEALSNAIRHGKPSHVDIRLERDDTSLTLQIRDDGVGLPKKPYMSDGVGFRTMRYRADLIGGKLAVASPPTGGTVVTCIIRRPRS